MVPPRPIATFGAQRISSACSCLGTASCTSSATPSTCPMGTSTTTVTQPAITSLVTVTQDVTLTTTTTDTTVETTTCTITAITTVTASASSTNASASFQVIMSSTTMTCDAAAATAVLANGDFETDLLAPAWIPTVDVQNSAAIVTPGDNSTYAFKAHNILPPNTLTLSETILNQEMVTCPGFRYHVSFNFKFSGLGVHTKILATVDNVSVVTINSDGTDGGIGTWASASGYFTATDYENTITFNFNCPNSESMDFWLDNVVITPFFL